MMAHRVVCSYSIVNTCSPIVFLELASASSRLQAWHCHCCPSTAGASGNRVTTENFYTCQSRVNLFAVVFRNLAYASAFHYTTQYAINNLKTSFLKRDWPLSVASHFFSLFLTLSHLFLITRFAQTN